MNCCPEDEHEDGAEWEKLCKYMTLRRKSIASEVVDDKVEDSYVMKKKFLVKWKKPFKMVKCLSQSQSLMR